MYVTYFVKYVTPKHTYKHKKENSSLFPWQSQIPKFYAVVARSLTLEIANKVIQSPARGPRCVRQQYLQFCEFLQNDILPIVYGGNNVIPRRKREERTVCACLKTGRMGSLEMHVNICLQNKKVEKYRAAASTVHGVK